MVRLPLALQSRSRCHTNKDSSTAVLLYPEINSLTISFTQNKPMRLVARAFCGRQTFITPEGFPMKTRTIALATMFALSNSMALAQAGGADSGFLANENAKR
jgi:hypothetical protein